jgi:hypothetical protein
VGGPYTVHAVTFQILPWIAVSAVLLLTAIAVLVWALRPRHAASTVPLPTEWAITARPVFSTEERRIYRLLREALPHHIVLSKLPLVRFCQPTDPNQVRYWFDLLGAHHVAFAVCSTNGRVLAAIDLDNERGASRRAVQIKQAVLAACRVRYLRCPVDHLPSIAELQLLVPQHAHTPRAPQPAPTSGLGLRELRSAPAGAAASRRAERKALWHDSNFFHDSFFAPDNRLDGLGSEFGALGTPRAPPSSQEPGNASAGEPRPPDPPSHPAPTRH